MMEEASLSVHTETPLICPPGYKRGCLYNPVGYGTVFKPLSEAIDILPWDEIRELIQQPISLRPFVKTILDQDGAGSCAAEATTQSIMTTRVRAGQQHVLLNPWSIYQKTSGGQDRGSNILDNLQFAKEFGCLPEAVWPRSNGPFIKPPKGLWTDFGQYFKIDEVHEAGETIETATGLVSGFAAVFGWQRHSCMLDDLLDEDTAEYVNSYDPSWGDQGFGKIKLRSVNYGYGLFLVRTTTICPPEVIEAIAEMGVRSAA